jgi:hypothetical protein
MMATDIIKSLPVVYFDASTLTTSYQVVPSSAFAFPVIMMTVVNDSTKQVNVSFDGVHDACYLRSASDRPLYFQTNAQPLSQKNAIPAQTQLWLKLPTGVSAGTGTIAIEAYYNQP